MHKFACVSKCEYANNYVSKSVHMYETLESMRVTDFFMLCANSKNSGWNVRMLGLVVPQSLGRKLVFGI